MCRYIVTGRIFDKQALIGYAICDTQTKRRFGVAKEKLFSLCNQKQVINCIVKNNELHSVYPQLQLSKFPRLNKSLRQTGNPKLYYSERGIFEYVQREYTRSLEKAHQHSKHVHISGGITDIESKKADEHAEKYYRFIRKLNHNLDVEAIARNIEYKYSARQIQKVKNYLFLDKHFIGYEKDKDGNDVAIYKQFDPNCAIAQSWQRLWDGKDIKPHDILLLDHEIYEMKLCKKMDQDKAHILATKLYDYRTASDNYYKSLKKPKRSSDDK